MGNRLYSERDPKRHAPERRLRNRAKKFDTEDSAKRYAEKNGIKDYSIVKTRNKFKIEKI